MVTTRKLLTFFVVVSLLLTFSSCGSAIVGVYIFSDLEECRSFETTDAHITVLDSPNQDEYIHDLEYVDFFACNYKSDEISFGLFAYEFESHEIAKEYYQKVTGKSNVDTFTFSDVTGLLYFRRIVIKDNFAYAIYTPPSNEDSALTIINETFSVKLNF